MDKKADLETSGSTWIKTLTRYTFRGSDGWLTLSRDLLALLTDSDLDVVSSGGVFKVVDGAQHVQGHVADVVRVKGRLVGNARHHHVGVANRLHLDRKSF